MRYVLGIDPTSGARSSLGLAMIDMETKSIIFTRDHTAAPSKELRVRLKSIASFLIKTFKEIEAMNLGEYSIGVEQTVMQGPGGESLNRAIGVIMLTTPVNRPLFHISNMQMKVIAGGHGRADKKEIGTYLKDVVFKENKESRELIFNLIASSRWDIIDAIGIGVTAYEKYYKKPSSEPAVKRNKPVKKSNNKG